MSQRNALRRRLSHFEKLKKAASDVQQLQDANRDLSQIIRDMEIKRKAMENAQEELDRR
jgi:hypothetical protein